jgi:aspartate racemase
MLTADEDELAALRRTSGRPAMDRLVYELDEAAQRIGHALGVLVPSDEDRPVVHRIIYEELCLGVINDESPRVYLAAIADLVERGADGIVLGCTEIGLLVGPGDADVPIFDSARVHAQRAGELALQEG